MSNLEKDIMINSQLEEDMNTEEKQREQQGSLQTKLWDIANTLRGSMEASEFKNYIWC